MTSTATLQRLKRLKEDFPLYAENCLVIRDKDGNYVPFKFNKAQKLLHTKLEEQIQQTGKVRALVLKGRQQGISTYTGARFYHRAATRRGINVYILAHEQPASDSLFSMVERYHQHNPLSPHTGVSNAKELRFDKLDSGYIVATAGQKAGGRSRTTTLFHGSEVGFWTNDTEHFLASVQTIPHRPGTEIILESTANSPRGEFYERWQDAINGESEYLPVFIPWFVQEEYCSPVPEGFQLSTISEDGQLSEEKYAELFGLTNAQMVWRRDKIKEVRSSLAFDQEYPATSEMAFVVADISSFITPVKVLEARKRKHIEPAGPKILGIDPAGAGKDRFAIAFRQGYVVPWIRHRRRLETGEALAWIRMVIEETEADLVFMDAGGLGGPILSAIRSENPHFAKIIKGVNFGGTSEHKMASKHIPGPGNRRTEMYLRLKEWFELEEGVSVPDDDALQRDLTSVKLKDSVSNDIYLESKKNSGVKSYDLGDALALTFATLRVSRMILPERRQIKSAAEQDREVLGHSGSLHYGLADNWMR